jgi:hypothetical protein
VINQSTYYQQTFNHIILAVNYFLSLTILKKIKPEKRATLKNITDTNIARTAEKFFYCSNRLAALRKLLNPKKLIIDISISSTIAIG